MQAEPFKTECPEPLPVHVTSLPAIQAAEHALTGQNSGKMLLQEGPGPICDPGQAVTRPRLCALSAHLASLGVYISVHQREDGAYLEAGAVGQRKHGAIGQGRPFD